jgi:serine protease Do
MNLPASLPLVALMSLIGLAHAQPAKKAEAAAISSEQFKSKLTRDDSALPAAGQLQMSYAPVVDKILPSVVTIFSIGSKPMEQDEINERLEQLPDFLREYMEEWLRQRGQLEDGEDETPERGPRGRRNRPSPPEEDPQDNEPNGVGSGVIISSDGYILTNNHVVGEAKKLEVMVNAGGSNRRYSARIIGTDPQTDVGLIKIEAQNLPVATIADSTKLRVGDVVLALGAPMELSRSVTQGIVSAMGRSGMGIIRNRSRMQQSYEDFIQTDAAINPGNSGGPLVDGMGRVVGINTAIYSRSGMNAGIGFAIPVNLALRIASDLVDDGKVSRGYLGIMPEDINADTAKLYNLQDESGAIVRIIKNNSPAAKAGLLVGDVILAVSGRKVDSASALPVIVSSYSPGSEITLDIVREGKRMQVKAKLEELTPEIAAGSSPAAAPPKAQPTSNALLPGLQVAALDEISRKRLKIPAEVQGLLVREVKPDSQARAMGVEKDDLITHINRKPVNTTAQATELAKQSEKTVLLKIWREGDSMLFMVGKR